MSARLTSAGWPRPIIGGLPIPWASPPDALATMNPSRARACATGAVCQVCGLGYQDGQKAYILLNLRKRPRKRGKAKAAWPIDNAVMHLRCVRLALGVCPRLKALLAKGELLLMKTKAHKAAIRRRKGLYRAMFRGEDCRVVPFERLAKERG